MTKDLLKEVLDKDTIHEFSKLDNKIDEQLFMIYKSDFSKLDQYEDLNFDPVE